ncbi:unnamed protein product [Caenorhabditis brenneri]
MSNEFLMDVVVVKKNKKDKPGTRNTTLKNRQMTFGEDYFKLTASGSRNTQDTLTFYVNQLANKPLKSTPGKTGLNILFDENHCEEHVSLILSFKPEYEQFIDLVIKNYNKLIELKKEKKTKKPYVFPQSNTRQVDHHVQPVFERESSSREPPKKIRASECPKAIPMIRDVKKEMKPIDVSRNDSSNGSKTYPPIRTQTSIPPPEVLMESTVKKPNDSLASNDRKTTKDEIQSNHFSDPLFCETSKETKEEIKSGTKHEIKSNSIGETQESPIRGFSPRSDEYRNRRLINTGNSCYLNATMQALASCPSFINRSNQLYRLTKFLESKYFLNLNGNEKLQNKSRLFRANLHILYTLSARLPPYSDNETRFPLELDKKTLTEIRQHLGKVNPLLDNNDQQDAHEYLLAILDAIDDVNKANHDFLQNGSVKQKGAVELNPNKAFQFKTETAYYCRKCQKRSCSSISVPNTILTLPITEKSCSIQDILEKHSNWSRIVRNCPHCGFNKAFTSERISEFPQCLIVHLLLYDNSSMKLDFRLENSFEVDATVIGDFPSKNKINFDESMDEKIETSLELCDVENKENFNADSRKLVGGNPDLIESSQSQDVIVENVKEVNFRFKFLSNHEDITAILRHLEISKNKNTKFQEHLETLSNIEDREMQQSDVPTKRIKILADGNCFYRAISWCLTGTEDNHASLRRATAKYLENNEVTFKKFCEGVDYKEFVNTMKSDGEWSGSCEIFAMASMLNVKIFTYLGKCGWRSHSPINNELCCAGSIYLANPNKHFEPTISIGKSDPSERQDQKIPRKNKNSDSKDTADASKTKPTKIEIERGYEETDVMDTHESTEKDPTDARFGISTEKVKYRLVSVICHNGESVHRGHYVAYTKGPLKTDEWMYCSDEEIEVATIEDVRRAIRKTGYILFYDRD